MIAFFLSLFFFFGCTPNVTFNQYDTYLYEVPVTDGEAEALPGEGSADNTTATFSATTDTASLALDVFGTDGNVYWFTVAPEQVDAMNTNWQNSWWGGGDNYSVDGESTYADPVMIMTADGEAADFGKIETWIIGQSTGYEWSETTIPNIRVDADEFQDDLKIGDYEHLRFNNAQVGSMLAEPAALALYNAVGYPAPQTSYAFVGGSPWNNQVLIPMIAAEVYKTSFCDKHADFFGGGCESIWEGWAADVTQDSVATLASQCQDGSCDSGRLQELAQVVSDHMYLEDFEAATSEYIDWPALHAFQCMSWLLWTGDDAFHNFNNILIALGDDGKFRYMPYSVDISAGMAWDGSYSDIPLYGYSAIPTGCQYDPTCWQETLDTCSALIDQIEALNPATTIIDQAYNRLATTKAPYGDDGGDGMLRDGDDERYETIHTFYANRWEEARAELANYPVMTFSTGCGDTGVVPPPGGGQAYPAETGCW